MAVVSGRPVTFLARALAGAGPSVRLFGVYGLEWLDGGEVRVAPEAEPWLAPAAEVVAAARRAAPPGVGVEAKGPALAIHWRRAPEAGAWAAGLRRGLGQRTGLVLQPGRRALELRPPLAIDKGQVVERVAAGCTAACFVGDDAGDLAAFAALDRLARQGLRWCGWRWPTRSPRPSCGGRRPGGRRPGRGPGPARSRLADAAGRRTPPAVNQAPAAASRSASQSPAWRRSTRARRRGGPPGPLAAPAWPAPGPARRRCRPRRRD